jgi:hypothetical protein
MESVSTMPSIWATDHADASMPAGSFSVTGPESSKYNPKRHQKYLPCEKRAKRYSTAPMRIFSLGNP